MAWKIILAVLIVLLVLLLIPIRYRFSLEMWKASVTVRALFGLVSKTIIFPKPKGKKKKENLPDEGTPAKIEEEQPIEIDRETGRAKEAPADEPERKAEEKQEKKQRKRPTLLQQIQFALENGAVEAVLKAAVAILAHSLPGRWKLYGEFGTGDPMVTGMLQGMTKAFLPGPTEEITWKYTESSYRIKGEGWGRIIPLYVIGIVLRLAVSLPIRQFWRYRQGGRLL